MTLPETASTSRSTGCLISARSALLPFGLAIVIGCGTGDGSGSAPDASATGGAAAAGASGGGTAGVSGGAGGAQAGSAGVGPTTPVGCDRSFADHFVVADSTEALFTQDFTVELWFKLDDYLDNMFGPLFSAVGTGVPSGVGDMQIRPALHVGNLWGEIGCMISVVETSEVSGTSIPLGPGLLGEWHHLACTRDDERLTLWLDGYAAGYMPNPWPFTDAVSLKVGATDDDLGWLPVAGEVTEVHVAGSVIYAQDFTPSVRVEPAGSSRLPWHLDDDCAASTVPDAAGGDHPGTWQLAP